MNEFTGRLSNGEGQNPLLKPCPFCGDTASLWETNDNHHYWWASCNGAIKTDHTKSCYGCIYPYKACYKTKEQAIEAWNRRANEAEIKSLNAQLRNARNELCLKCSKYQNAHNGACDGCRWKEG